MSASVKHTEASSLVDTCLRCHYKWICFDAPHRMIKCSLKADKFIQTSFRNLLLKEFSELGDNNLFNIALATGEALQNIVRYGYNFLEGMGVEVILVQAGETFVVEILDTAPPCPTESFMQQHFTPSDHGGMGLGIIKKLTQTFEITPLVKGNRTKLIFALEL